MKRWIALLIAFSLLLCPALAAEGEGAAAPEPPAWVTPYLADAYALDLLDDDAAASLAAPVTGEEMEELLAAVAEKLTALDGAQRSWSVAGTTRGAVISALHATLRGGGLPGSDQEPVQAFSSLGVIRGDGGSMAMERPCTYAEAVVMAVRLVLAEYDAMDAGSRGILWKAVNGENVLYLLGTYHVDRGDLYPLHKRVRRAVEAAEQVVMELDLGDDRGLAELAAMQVYGDGETLKDHVSRELYDRTVAACAAIGLDEDAAGACKPWALANALNAFLSGDETTGDTRLAVDGYLYALAANAGTPVAGAETYALQGGIFDSLSPDYQEEYLEAVVSMLELTLAGEDETADPAAQAAAEALEVQMDALMDAWKAGDTVAFAQSFDKTAVVTSGDELNAKLFTDRDPGMIQAARSYLELEGSHVNLMAVGAGHLLYPGGILLALEEMGYAVEEARGDDPLLADPAEPERFTIDLSFAGDAMLATYQGRGGAGSFQDHAARQSPDYFLAGVQEVFAQDDFTIVNLENTLTDQPRAAVSKSGSPVFWFKGPTSNAGILTAGSVEMVSLSNNHTEDYGPEGLEDTKRAVEAAGLQWGNRDRTVYLEKNGYTIAVICGGMWNATSHADLLARRIREADLVSDLQIVFFHGGTEGVHAPDKWKVAACHKLVDAGADLVVGSHPHVLQPRETYQGVDIVYSLGNFCYGGATRPENATAIYRLRLTVEDGTLTAKTGTFAPCYVYTGSRNNFQPRLIAEDDPAYQRILDFLDGRRSTPL